MAYACRDSEATRVFYEDLFGFPLIHTEVSGVADHFLRHVFFDTGDGSCIAFFDVHGVGEQPGWSTEVSTGNGLPVWVNHVAFTATAERQNDVKQRCASAGIEPLMDIDHGWCHSVYFLDPNGIMVELCRDTPGIPVEPALAASLLSFVPL